jgi:outer membrane protein
MSFKHLLPLMVATLAAAGAAQAQGLSFKVGATLYQPHSKSDGVRGIGIPPGADVDVGSATTMILVAEYAFTPNVAAELVLGIPPRVKAKATGSVAFLGDDVLSAKNVAPTLIMNYTFGDASRALRPYVGIGVNYTRFVSIRSRLAPDVKMSDSVGPLVQAGLKWQLSPKLGMFVSVARVDVQTEVIGVASTVLTSNIDFRPITYSLGVSYRY